MPAPNQPPAQLPLPLGADVGRLHPQRQSKKQQKRARYERDVPALPIKERRFLPVVVGEKWQRKDCPTERPCPRIKCRQHLFLEDAEHRAGRPGLRHVPRDSRGWTVPVDGDMGEERAGTTVNPRWLELERRCSVWVERDEHGAFVTLHASYEGEWEHFRERLHLGEPIDVLVDGKRVGGARMTPDGIALDHQPTWFSAVLERVRGVPSCALDEAALGVRSNEQVGDALARHRTLVAREVKNAAQKLKRAGVDLRDLMNLGGEK